MYIIPLGSSAGLRVGGDLLFSQDTDGIPGVAEAFDQFGQHLLSSDISGDGAADLVVGAPREDLGGIIDAGAIYVAPGVAGSGLDLADTTVMHQNTGGIVGVAEDFDGFGWQGPSAILDASGAGAVRGYKFDDRNADGEPGDAEPPSLDVSFVVSGASAAFDQLAVRFETASDVAGEFTFANLLPGTYTVVELVPFGWASSTHDVLEPSVTLSLAAGEDVVALPGQAVHGRLETVNDELTFGNSRVGAIVGFVFEDLDGAGVWDRDLDAFVVNDGSDNGAWMNDGLGVFTDSGQLLGIAVRGGVGLGDLDGDGDLDAFTGRFGRNRVWVNDGTGTFTDSGRSLGTADSLGVDLGDLDGDGDLDAFVANLAQPNRVWLNNGSGAFSDSGQLLGDADSNAVALGDVDRDGDFDAFIANDFGANAVWINDGTGGFIDSGQAIGDSDTFDLALGDVDGDGDLDAFVANLGQPNRVWTNDGGGGFADTGQELGTGDSRGVVLSDLDGDGDLDAFVVNDFGTNAVWVNNGLGDFSSSVEAIGDSDSFGLGVGDLDHDGDVDAFVTNLGQPNRVWVNDGLGAFSDFGAALGEADSVSVALGDLDGDAEPLLEGIRVTLRGTDVFGERVGPVSVTTDVRGEFRFADLIPGEYTITVTPPDGMEGSTSVTVDLTLSLSEVAVAERG